MLVKFEHNHMGQTTRNFELSDIKRVLKTIFDKAVTRDAILEEVSVADCVMLNY